MPFAIPIVCKERKKSHYELKFLHDKPKRNKSLEQAQSLKPRCTFCQSLVGFPIPEPDGNMEYGFDSEHRDMTVVAGDDIYKPE